MIKTKRYVKNITSVSKKGILIVTPTYYPDVGGVETHLTDLVNELSKRSELKIFVATYKPIATSGVKSYIKKEVFDNVVIYRFWWFGWNLFHFFEKYPFLLFLYLCPYLLLRTFILMLFNKKRIDVIHGQGLTGAYVGMILKKIFKKRLVVSTHTVYENVKEASIIAKLIRYILNQADKVLCVSKASSKQMLLMGVRKEKLDLYKHWIDLDVFRPLNKTKIRQKLGLPNKFTVLFVGRLIEMKGIKNLCEAAKENPKINFIFIGHGPLEDYLLNMDKQHKNILFLGKIDNKEINQYYNLADIFCLPSQKREGFGRVIMEAIACGIPVVASNKGGIPDALDDSISVLINPNIANLNKAIRLLYEDRDKLLNMKSKTGPYAIKNFSNKNIELIARHY